MTFDWAKLLPLLRILFIVGGFAAITVALWLVDYRAGVAALGVSLFLIERLAEWPGEVKDAQA